MKSTERLAIELRLISKTLPCEYCREVLVEAAERLIDTAEAAEQYRIKAEAKVKKPFLFNIRRKR